jgi:hypothetical protein
LDIISVSLFRASFRQNVTTWEGYPILRTAGLRNVPPTGPAKFGASPSILRGPVVRGDPVPPERAASERFNGNTIAHSKKAYDPKAVAHNRRCHARLRPVGRPDPTPCVKCPRKVTRPCRQTRARRQLMCHPAQGRVATSAAHGVPTFVLLSPSNLPRHRERHDLRKGITKAPSPPLHRRN